MYMHVPLIQVLKLLMLCNSHLIRSQNFHFFLYTPLIPAITLIYTYRKVSFYLSFFRPFVIFTRRCVSVYLGVVVLPVWFFAAKELSSYLTRQDKSFTPLVCWTTQLIQYVPIHNKNSVISRQCLKICTSSMQTCLEPNYNIGHKWLQPRE